MLLCYYVIIIIIIIIMFINFTKSIKLTTMNAITI